jgi:transcriptional regulator with XRE-family HTH domain
MRRSALETPRVFEAPKRPRGVNPEPQIATAPSAIRMQGRRATDPVQTPVSPEQIKTARELLGWSQAELAAKLGVSETAVSLFEREKRRLLALDVAELRSALESAGVEFTNFGEPGVRLHRDDTAMTLEAFLSELDLYEHNRLRPKGIRAENKGVKFGFALLYTDRAAASLALEGKELGRLRWKNGTVEFDPPVAPSNPARPFEEDLDQWASRAYARHLSVA